MATRASGRSMRSGPSAPSARSVRVSAVVESTGEEDEAREEDRPRGRGRKRMNLLVWGMMGIAIWHFAVFVPDRFWGGIVGAFIAAVAGAMIIGLAAAGGSGGKPHLSPTPQAPSRAPRRVSGS